MNLYSRLEHVRTNAISEESDLNYQERMELTETNRCFSHVRQGLTKPRSAVPSPKIRLLLIGQRH
jgi:hypothetical protein